VIETKEVLQKWLEFFTSIDRLCRIGIGKGFFVKQPSLEQIAAESDSEFHFDQCFRAFRR
jgi:hypothetical protein